MMMDGGVTNMASVRFTLSSAAWPAVFSSTHLENESKIYVGWWAKWKNKNTKMARPAMTPKSTRPATAAAAVTLPRESIGDGQIIDLPPQLLSYYQTTWPKPPGQVETC